MLQLGKCAKDNSKRFLLNRKVSKLAFIKLGWNFLGHLYKNQNLKFKIQQKIFNKKDAENISQILLFMKNHL